MKNIFARHTTVKIDAPSTDLKNYRFFGDEMEVLGNRLDAARKSRSNCKTAWGRWYWQETVDRLMLQWQALPVLHDADAQVTIVPRWQVSYDFYEKDYYNEHNGITDRAYNKVFRESVDLDASWEAHRAARLARAQF
jgi:hypothetical protein